VTTVAEQVQPGATTPQRFPETTPATPADYTQFTLTTVMELQKAVGGLTHAVEGLSKQSDEQGKKIDEIRHQVSFVKGALWVGAIVVALASGLAGWLSAGKVSIIIGQHSPPTALTHGR